MTETIELNGVKIRFREEDRGIIREVFRENPYRIEEIPEGALVIDIGAHIGTVTLRCAVERRCRVCAYEPSCDNFALLVENVGLNHLEDRVKCFNQAIGGRREVRVFHNHPLSSGGGSLSLGENPDFAGLPLKVERVQCITLKDIFEENGLSFCDVLKMDCEGAERDVFTDDADPYFRRVGRVLLEWHNYDGHVYANYLKRLGFSVLLTGCGDPPPPPYDPTFGRGMLYSRRLDL